MTWSLCPRLFNQSVRYFPSTLLLSGRFFPIAKTDVAEGALEERDHAPLSEEFLLSCRVHVHALVGLLSPFQYYVLQVFHKRLYVAFLAPRL